MTRYLLLVKEFLLRNAHLKFVSLLLAFLLWITINGEPKSEVGFKVPLEYRNPPPGIEILGETVNTVDVRVSASSSMVKRLGANDLTAVLDLAEWSPGERTYAITPSNIKVPFGVTIAKITPSKVRLRFEQTRKKTVSIRPRLIGKIAEGYRLGGAQCQPDKVTIEGPESRLSRINFASTDTIDIAGWMESHSVSAHLYVEDPLVRFSGNQQTTVEIAVVPMSLTQGTKAGVRPTEGTK